jgi:hypothetical protein
MMNYFKVLYYVNGVNTSVLEHLPAEEAYLNGVPGEALLNLDNGGRWHVMNKDFAVDTMCLLLPGETLRVCWQHSPENGIGDTEHILIMKESI